jgi:hypothetical protein
MATLNAKNHQNGYKLPDLRESVIATGSFRGFLRLFVAIRPFFLRHSLFDILRFAKWLGGHLFDGLSALRDH